MEIKIAYEDQNLRLYSPDNQVKVPVANPHNLIWANDRHAEDVVYRRTKALLHALQNRNETTENGAFKGRLEKLQPGHETDEALFLRICALRREIALSNPLLGFDSIIYSKGGGGWNGGLYHTAPYMGFKSQAVAQDKRNGKMYNKWTVEDWQGGFDFSKPDQEEAPWQDDRRNPGLFIAQNWRSNSIKIEPLLQDSKIINGRNEDKVLSAFSGPWHFAFDLSYDGNEAVFAKALGENAPVHIFWANLQTGEVRQLTDSWFPDWEPAFLPNGRIAFVSLRRWVSARCQSYMPQPCGTLFSMAGDGSDLYPISWHETSEMFPVVTNDGRLVYSRWDYIDRGTVIAHNLWTCFPDGRDPRAPHGNYGIPNMPTDKPKVREITQWLHSSRAMEALNATGGKTSAHVIGRPMAEFHIRPVPGRTGLYSATASIHHGGGYGHIVLIDTKIPDDGMMSQVRIVKGNALGAEFGQGKRKYLPPEFRWSTPWPLSEEYFLATRLDTSGHPNTSEGIFLVDVFGNMELLVDDDGVSPRPFAPREKPPVIPTQTWQGERSGEPGHKRAVISVLDAYQSDLPWPEGTEIKALRIMQIVPVPWGGYCNQRIGATVSPENPNPFRIAQYGWTHGRACIRAVLGTVPVEKDGSAYFEAPVGKEILFQALDENGMAVQSMRTGTYVHPGEHLSCGGCHRTTVRTPQAAAKKRPLAMARPASRIQPEPQGSLPLNYYRLVKPVLDQNCLPCHREKNKGPQTSNIDALEDYVSVIGGVGAYDRTDTVPGQYGAHASKLGHLLLTSHKDRISPEDKRRLIVWMDANALELGALHHQAEQRSGQVIWPLLEVDPENPIGTEVNIPER
ncbi:MAG: hypothetical protein ACLFQ6_12600 [Candidatus Sumerlaeia bacterium]